MKKKLFRYCMLVGAASLLGMTVFYLVTYWGLTIAIGNSGLKPFYQQMIRALWLSFGLQASLLGVLYLIVAYRPRTVSREVVVICGLIPLAEAVLVMSLTGSYVAMLLLSVAAVFVLLGSTLWPKAVADSAAAPPASATGP
jgi:hypothetical protein